MDASHKLDSRNSDVTECPLSSSDSRVDGTMDDAPISQNDRLPLPAAEQPVGPVDSTSGEGHAISRFPVSFTRTHLPGVHMNRGPSVYPTHCSRYTRKGQNSRPLTRSKGAYSDAISCHPVSIIYRHVESFAKKSFFISPMVENHISGRERWLGIIHS
jgi:hypothetical protein